MAPENMVYPLAYTGPFQADDVLGLLDNADQTWIPFGVLADAAGGAFREIAADVAAPDVVLDLLDRVCQGHGLCFGSLEYVKGEAFGCFGANTGESPKFLDESGQAFCVGIVHRDSERLGLERGVVVWGVVIVLIVLWELPTVAFIHVIDFFLHVFEDLVL